MISTCCSSVNYTAGLICCGLGFRSRTNNLGRGRDRLVVTSVIVSPPSRSRSSSSVVIQNENQMKILDNRPWLMLSSMAKPESRLLYDVLLVDDDQEKKEEEKVIQVILPSSDGTAAGERRRRGHRCVGSSEGFIIYFDGETNEVTAVNPFTDQQLSIPSTYTLSVFTEDLQRAIPRGKAILSPSRDTIVIVTMVYPIFSPIGGSHWNVLPQPCGQFCDCTFHKGRLYCVNNDGDIVVYDLEYPLAAPFFAPTHLMSVEYEMFTRFLVESPDGNDLFLVFKGHPRVDIEVGYSLLNDIGPCIFRVFKLARDDLRWDEVENVGNLAFFLGLNHSLSLLASDFSGIKSNCIYYADDDDYRMCDEDVDMDKFAGVFDLRAGNLQFYKFDDYIRKLKNPPPIWFMPSSV